MAAAEARAAWQRSANRCFFNDEVKRASLFSGHSSSSADDSDAAAPMCMVHGIKQDQPSKTKWWLDGQPKNPSNKYFMYEQLNAHEVDHGVSRAGLVSKDAIGVRDYQFTEENKCYTRPIKDDYSVTEKPEKISTAFMSNSRDIRMQELKAVSITDPFRTAKSKDVGDFHYLDSNFIELDSSNSSNSKHTKKLSSDFESDWLHIEKNEPWWRTADKDDLASFVSRKSQEHIENCDLPPPQAQLLGSGPSLSLECFGCDSVLSSSMPQTTESNSPILPNYGRQCTIASSVDGTKTYSQSSFSKSHISGGSFSHEKSQDGLDISENDLNRAQLVEALCHSQTRAREAEEAAQKAYNEKERLVTLFFRQASELFAYKQWLQLLQLENFCLQLRNKDHMFSTVFPAAIPWVSFKGRTPRRRRHRAGKRKRNSRHGLSKCAVAFAVGFGLAGAGLLFGWCMGWLVPGLHL